MEFTIRPLTGVSGLDGAFRVHISSKDLESLHIKPGEVCHLRSPEGTIASGIAWRSTDAPRSNAHPVKASDVFRDTFNIKLGTQVTIAKAAVQLSTADRLVVKDVTEYDGSIVPKNDGKLNLRIKYALGSVEGIATGTKFEVQKRPFVVHEVKSGSEQDCGLWSVNDSTEVVIEGYSTGGRQRKQDAAPPVSKVNKPIKTLRGLDKQYVHLRRKALKFQKPSSKLQRNDGNLLFGPPGVGKSMIIDKISQLSWRKVLRIDQSTVAGTTSKAQAAVAEVFSEALSNQPSMIIMDDLHLITGSQRDDTSITTTLTSQFSRIESKRVFVLAAVPDVSSINETLRRPGRLYDEVEIPAPAQQSRSDMLKDFHNIDFAPSPGFDGVAEDIGARTHGYTGADLLALYLSAIDCAEQASLSEGHVEALDFDSDLEENLDAPGDNPLGASLIEPLLKDFEHAMLEIRPTAMKEVVIDVPKVQWSQIGGCHDIRKLLTEAVEWPLKHPDTITEYGMSAQKGILLYGPPGCSKTMTAQAIATSSGLNFLAVKGAELISMYVGESERAVRDVFRKARAAAPSILFFDEIDSIGGERGAGQAGLNVLTTLLNEMDGIEGLSGVLVLAATNRPESLDPALLRPGRFDNVLYIGPPDDAARRQVFEIVTARVPRGDIDFEALVARTEGFSGADITNVCRNAAKVRARQVIAARERGEAEAVPREVSGEDFEEAMREARSSIPAEMVEGFRRWQAGL